MEPVESVYVGGEMLGGSRWTLVNEFKLQGRMNVMYSDVCVCWLCTYDARVSSREIEVLLRY